MNIKHALVGAAALGGLVLASGTASAMPNGIPTAAVEQAVGSNVQDVRWVCGLHHRCWWRRGWYGGYAYYGAPRVWWGPRWGWGWRHRWWHRWG
jgi:hypothetical protein